MTNEHEPWSLELLGPILRPLFDATVEELGRNGVMARAELALRVGGNPKTLESLLRDMANFGVVRFVGRPRPSVRLTTLGEHWLVDTVGEVDDQP